MNNDISECNYNNYAADHNSIAVRVRKDYTPLHVYLGCVWVVIDIKYITYEGLLHNTLALDVDTVQEAACIQQTRI